MQIKFLKCTQEDIDYLKERKQLEMNWVAGDDSYPVYKFVYSNEILGLIQFDNIHENYMYIGLFEVVKDKRRNHIGSALVDFFIKRYEKLGYMFETYPETVIAVCFWECCGFTKMDDGAGTPIWVKQ